MSEKLKAHGIMLPSERHSFVEFNSLDDVRWSPERMDNVLRVEGHGPAAYLKIDAIIVGAVSGDPLDRSNQSERDIDCITHMGKARLAFAGEQIGIIEFIKEERHNHGIEFKSQRYIIVSGYCWKHPANNESYPMPTGFGMPLTFDPHYVRPKWKEKKVTGLEAIEMDFSNYE